MSTNNSKLVDKVVFVLDVLVCIVAFIFGAVVGFYDWIDDSIVLAIVCSVGYGLLIASISLGVALSTGKIILIPLAALLTLPFINLKDNHTKTKWRFDDIPKIKRFMNKELPHTHS